MSSINFDMRATDDLDLADQAMWEDIVDCEDFDNPEFGGRADSRQPVFGLSESPTHGVHHYVVWWSDGEDSRYCDN